MARSRQREIPPSCKTYGFPLYCASWVPLDKIAAAAGEEEEAKEETGEGDGAEDASPGTEGSAGEGSAAHLEVAGDGMMLLLGGGGGEGRSGIPNALLLARFDPASRSLAEDPVHRLATGQDVPYRMALHPRGDGVLCSFPNGCRWFEWDLPDMKVHKLALKTSGRRLTQLEDASLQLALAFNAEGSLLATGSEDGHTRVFKWPAMEAILEQTETNQSVKDLDFSHDGKYFASVGNNGQCRVWDLNSLLVVANLSREDGEKFGFCRFSQVNDTNMILYTTSTQGQFGRVVSWSATTWNRITSKRVVNGPISAFSVSSDGKLLAVGTIEGDVVILNSDLQVHTTVKQAHLGLVTTLAFSHDSRALVSASFDSSTRVTLVEKPKTSGGNSLWVVVLVIILAILIYFMKARDVV